MIGIIAKHEIASLFRSVQTWLLAAVLSLLFGYWFLQQLELFLGIQAQLATRDHPVGLSGYMSVRYLEPLTLLFSAIAPLIAMRTFSDEFRHETFALWQSSPVSDLSLVLGKYAGVMSVLGALVLLAASLLLLLRFFLPIDWLLTFSATAGLLLCTSACAACGLFFSTLTRHGLIAVTASLALLALLWMLGSANMGKLPLEWLSALSIAHHLRGFFQGYVRSEDVIYFLLLTALFLALAVIRLDSLRQTGR